MLTIETIPAIKKVTTDDHVIILTTIKALTEYYVQLKQQGVSNKDIKNGYYIDPQKGMQTIDDCMNDDYEDVQQYIDNLIMISIDFNGMDDILLNLTDLNDHNQTLQAFKDYEPHLYRKCQNLQKYAKKIEKIL